MSPPVPALELDGNTTELTPPTGGMIVVVGPGATGPGRMVVVGRPPAGWAFGSSTLPCWGLGPTGGFLDGKLG